MLKTVKIQKEDEPKKKKRTSRVNARSSKNINQINQEEIKTEKDYTQGQEHIPEHEISEKPENISSTNIQENEQTSNEETSGKKVICIETGKEYETLAAAAKDCNYSSPSHISTACRGLRKTAAGYHWQFIEKEKGEKTNE